MTLIEKSLDLLTPSHATSLTSSSVWLSPDGGLLARIAAEIASRHVHPSRVVVLLPYGQLLALANRLWAQTWPDGFAPRFETTKNWALTLGAQAPQPHAVDDYRFDAAIDSLTARSLLERTGFAQVDVDLMPRLLQACGPLANRAAAVAPNERLVWVTQVREALSALNGESPAPQALRLESAITQLALTWAAFSSYATDVLWAAEEEGAPLRLMHNVDCLIVLKGFQDDPLSEALAAQFGDKAIHLPLVASAPQGHTSPQVQTHAALDFEEEALWAAACVLRHVADREAAHEAAPASDEPLPPIALVATDRTLTRRSRAMLETQGLSIRDETGWTLSTTRAAATLMTQLQACGWQASSDAVLDWLKNSPAFPEPLVGRLENLLRQARCTLWRDRDMSVLKRKTVESAEHAAEDAPPDELIAFAQNLQQQLSQMQSPRPLRQWWVDVVAHLQTSGVWPLMQEDSAAQELIAALHLSDTAQAALADWPLADRRMRLDEFTAWVRHALESSSYQPPSVGDSHVVILPMAQLLSRPFYAVVLPACDEVRLSASPELPSSWTGPERIALGLPTREDGAAMQLAAWQQALQCPRVDVLHRKTDNGGETLLPSPLLQLHLLAQQSQPSQQSQNAMNTVAVTAHKESDEGRFHSEKLTLSRPITAQPTPQPRPRGQTLPVKRLSASAYEDLRRCPYRFFALRQLGLKEASELDSELEKRDFGDWLHEVLKDFHEALAALPPDSLPLPVPTRQTLLDQCADTVRERRKFSAGEFLPYQAAWPRLRDGYLDWLAEFEATGAHFVSAETWHEMGLGPITLVGRIDRIDASKASADAPAFLLDYKTEPPTKTKERLKNPLEDTQIAFYAALLPDDSLRAAYLNLNEKEGTQLIEQTDVVDTRDTLIAGILDDMQRIADGAVLAALGEGVACDYCAARGLCRKDFWETV